PSGAVNINATFRPTAHAVGYFLAPLRGFRSPGALSKRLWGAAPGYSISAPAGLRLWITGSVSFAAFGGPSAA
ncbi:MAG: hypothetical protein ABSF46_30150, partial [Terriglobia bacterium]